MTFHKGFPVYNRLIVFLISISFGMFGMDRIYLKDYITGLLKFITLGGLGIWYFIDLFHICIGKKIGSETYYWTCELSKSNNCNKESYMIRKYLLYIVIALFLCFIWFYPKKNNLILHKNNVDDE